MYGYKIAIVAALASAVAAQNLPSCAQSCVTNYNGCNQLDVSCICNSAGWIEGLACCVSEVCDASDQEETIQFANTICAAVGVTTLPQTATCASGASSSFSTGAATVSASLTSVVVTTSASASGSASLTSSTVLAIATASSGSASVIASSSSSAKASSSAAAQTTASISTTATGNGAVMHTAAPLGLAAILAAVAIL